MDMIRPVIDKGSEMGAQKRDTDLSLGWGLGVGLYFELNLGGRVGILFVQLMFINQLLCSRFLALGIR